MRIVNPQRGIAAAVLAAVVFGGVGVTTAMAAGIKIHLNCTGYEVNGGNPGDPYSVVVDGATVVSGVLDTDGYTAGTLRPYGAFRTARVSAGDSSDSVRCGDPDPDPTPEPTTPKPTPTPDPPKPTTPDPGPTSATPTPTPPVVTDPPSPSPTATPTITATSTPKPTATKTAEPRPRPTSIVKPPRTKPSVAPPTRKPSATHDSPRPPVATKKSGSKQSGGKPPQRDDDADVPAMPHTGLD